MKFLVVSWLILRRTRLPPARLYPVVGTSPRLKEHHLTLAAKVNSTDHTVQDIASRTFERKPPRLSLSRVVILTVFDCTNVRRREPQREPEGRGVRGPVRCQCHTINFI
ncbi:hypothetical protein L226DRAFT_539198 [Lentinus tigrinus ALCF2SS1-7]|uniref:Uncharacterized protein n=1 Tax=Lentinus tigrinus ALCF2SS1-6 TaxID=1328759 RepID=A0A5C2RVC8_9APHY|nr:hypothetical protein L227DRAFT_579900 [Lentinus tigrinus ALCF2SS1-6]RPD70174.1 hypothetical protein L226DRAFT_539198 [Lentinus tigrinus ALCF2SS1-7]